MINWKTIIIGSVLVVILNVALSMIAGSLGSLIAYLLAAMYIGYTVGGDYKNIAVHGGLICAILAIILGVFTIITSGVLAEENIDILVVVVTLLIWAIFNGIIGVIGSIIGSLIKGSRSSKGSTA